MIYNWESAIFASSDDVINGYPFPKDSHSVVEFDIYRVYSVWEQDVDVLSNYFYPGTPPCVFDITKVYSNWNLVDSDLFGYITPNNVYLYKSGAFAHTTGIQSITFPLSVKKLGYYTCYKSAIEDVTISPTCIAYDTTFPDNCTFTYYSGEINSVSFPISPIEFFVGDDYEEALAGTVVNVTVSDSQDSITLYAPYFRFEDISTNTEVQSATGKVVFTSFNGDVIDTYDFTYKVKPIPVKESLIPVMTSDTTPSGTVISSGYFSTRYAWLAFDGVDSQTWSRNSWGDATNALDNSPDACYVGYVFTQNVDVTDITISFTTDRVYTGCFQCRVNNEWVTTIGNIPIANGYTKLDLSQVQTTCDAVRFCVLSGNGEYFTTNYYGGNVCELTVIGYK
jgi:hypothetical protein